MRELKQLLRDRRRRQRGSILSGILIIVVFLTLLIGGLLTELTGSFTVSRALVTRVRRRKEAWLAQRLQELSPDELVTLRAAAPIIIRDVANVATSFPGFVPLARSAGFSHLKFANASGKLKDLVNKEIAQQLPPPFMLAFHDLKLDEGDLHFLASPLIAPTWGVKVLQ